MLKSPFTDLDERIKAFAQADIYPVISSEFCNGRHPLEVLRGVVSAGVKVVQLREKNLCKNKIYELGIEYRKITAEHGVLLIINDHTDVALALNADGVHLGQEDLPLVAAKQIAPQLLFGVSTHDPHEASDAVRDGAGYINIGPIYPTSTKHVSCGAVGIKMLKSIAPGLSIPFSVMGGIKAQHITELLAAGARQIAMVTEITKADDVMKKTMELRSLFRK
ncbi:MAG: thiamine phosphate synthase [Victivallaceae bacterium]|nr:thiamine phosphate synthase [Victivallaceae bacterium]